MASPTTPFEKAWADVRAAAGEVKECFDILLSDGEPPKAHSSNAALPIRTWRKDAQRYLLAVNPAGETAKTSVDVEGGVAEARVRVGQAEYRVQDGKIEMTLEPRGYVVCEF